MKMVIRLVQLSYQDLYLIQNPMPDGLGAT